MPELRLTTWNVLHRVHAVNWGEDAVEAFPDEGVRIARISELVSGWLQAGVSIVCLQEVSGDQLASLRARVAPGVVVLDHCYSRVPKRREPGPRLLTDPKEHLVVLSSLSDAHMRSSRTFDSDPGKGYLEVAAGRMRALCTHVSFGARREKQLAVVAAVARSGGPVAVLGDFNAEAQTVRASLGEGFALADLTGERPTRRATRSSLAHTIDHVAAVRGRITSARVLDGQGLSDHEPVEAGFEL